MKAPKVNAYIMHIFGKIELFSIHATLNYYKCITLMTSKRQRHYTIIDYRGIGHDVISTLEYRY